jgi:hypothetical protein
VPPPRGIRTESTVEAPHRRWASSHCALARFGGGGGGGGGRILTSSCPRAAATNARWAPVLSHCFHPLSIASWSPSLPRAVGSHQSVRRPLQHLLHRRPSSCHHSSSPLRWPAVRLSARHRRLAQCIPYISLVLGLHVRAISPANAPLLSARPHTLCVVALCAGARCGSWAGPASGCVAWGLASLANYSATMEWAEAGPVLSLIFFQLFWIYLNRFKYFSLLQNS